MTQFDEHVHGHTLFDSPETLPQKPVGWGPHVNWTCKHCIVVCNACHLNDIWLKKRPYICIHLQYMHWNASIKFCPIEQTIQILKIKGTTYPWRSVSRHLMTAVCPKPNKWKNWKTLLPNYCWNFRWIGKKRWFETLAKHVRCVWYHPFVTVLKKKYRKSVFNNTNLGFVKFKDNCETVANILLKSMFFF